MPGTPEEYTRYATAEWNPDLLLTWEDGTAITREEQDDIVLLRAYVYRVQRHRNRDRKPQRTAMRLLRSFLSTTQTAQLRSNKAFLVETPSGKSYRLYPRMGTVEQVTRHGRSWFVFRRFCLHDDPDASGSRMPPADLSLAHMLLLLADEAEFLRLANASTARDQLWNGEYRRRLARARRAPVAMVSSP